MKYIDTHAHIHFDEFKDILGEIFDNSHQTGVETIITVGTDDADSRQALNFAISDGVKKLAGPTKLFASAGIHPHQANLGGDAFLSIKELAQNDDYSEVLVAIGECGLDYFKNLSSQAEQKEMLSWQIQLAGELDLPIIFHVRDAWDDFFAIIKKHPKLKGVIHSFTGNYEVVKKASQYELYFGLNGIITFTKNEAQLDAVKAMPKERIILETDCPFLAPVPMRGKQNEPSYIKYTADFIANLRGEAKIDFCNQVIINSNKLFRLEN